MKLVPSHCIALFLDVQPTSVSPTVPVVPASIQTSDLPTALANAHSSSLLPQLSSALHLSRLSSPTIETQASHLNQAAGPIRGNTAINNRP